MRGSYRITVSNTKVRYDFTVRRNITIVKGDSATGKTTLVEMIREYDESGKSSGIVLNCEKDCRVLSGKDWKLLLSVIHETIVFIDEDNAFLPTNEFAQAVRESDNYYVIVTREGLPNLPYSVEEIYGIRESGKYASLKQIYNEFYPIYGRENDRKAIRPKCVIVEDSNAGYEFFLGVSKGKEYSVISAGGKSNIFRKIMDNYDENVLIIADGAAFGPEMDRVMKIVKRRKGLILYVPESFEWLILKSGILSGQDLQMILEKPEDYIESRAFFSWERYFTNLLVTMTKDTYVQYTKRKLNGVYLEEKVSLKILKQMEGIDLADKK